MAVTEEAVTFGPDGSLIGILTRPDGVPTADIACLIPNAGLVYRIGPRRVSVKLARSLGQGGWPTLRFDLAGVGDSKHVGDYAAPRERNLADMREALDAIERATGIRRFVILGICSGAVNGFRTALADERVTGVLMYDGYWYRSRWTGFVRIAKRLVALRPGELWGGVTRRWRALRTPATEAAAPLNDLDVSNPPRDQFVAQVDRLVRRGVRLCFVYGGGVLQYYSYGDQFKDVFGAEAFFPHVRAMFRPGLDHMLSTGDAQRLMQSLVVDWMADVQAEQSPLAVPAPSAGAIEAKAGVSAQ